MPYRILTLVHAHISESFGGSEHAAFALHDAYEKHHQAWILTPGAELRSTQPERDLRIKSKSDTLTLTCHKPDQRDEQLALLLEQINPRIIHLHHYLNFGIDIIKTLKKLCPNATIILTLHEYLLLCAHDGQMLKRGSNRICSTPCVESCSDCFQGLDQNLFTRRQISAQTALKACDGVISPSEWLLSTMEKYFDLPDSLASSERITLSA